MCVCVWYVLPLISQFFVFQAYSLTHLGLLAGWLAGSVFLPTLPPSLTVTDTFLSLRGPLSLAQYWRTRLYFLVRYSPWLTVTAIFPAINHHLRLYVFSARCINCFLPQNIHLRKGNIRSESIAAVGRGNEKELIKVSESDNVERIDKNRATGRKRDRSVRRSYHRSAQKY